MLSKIIKVLLIEDDEDDYLITRDVIDDIPGNRYALKWVSTFEEGLQAIQENSHDVYLVDYRLGSETGLKIIDAANNLEVSIPVILLTGNDDLDLDIEAMELGASDFLIKGQIDAGALDRAMRYALKLNRTLNQLKRNKSRLKEAQEIALVGNFEWDVINDVITWSDQHYRIFDLEPQSIPIDYKTFLSHIHPDDIARMNAGMKALQSETVESEMEYNITTATNQVKHVYGKGKAHKDQNGKVIRISGITQDVTELKERQHRLNLLSASLENAAIPIVWANLNRKTTFVNQAFLDLWGYPEETELMGRDTREFGGDPANVDAIMDAIEKEGFWVGEDTARKKDGTLFRVFASTHLIKDNSGQPISMMASFIDLTKLKEQEIQIQKEQQKAQTYLEMAGSIIVVIDIDEKVKLVNREGTKVLGLSENEIVGKNWFDEFIPEEEREAVKYTFGRIVLGELENLKYFENLILTRDKGLRLIRWYNRIIWDEDGNITGAISSGIDITEQRAAEKVLEENRIRLENYTTDLERAVQQKTRELIFSAEKLKQASHLTKIGYWEINFKEEQPIATFSKEYCQLYGVEEETLIDDRRYFLQFIFEEDREKVILATKEAIENGGGQFHYRAKRVDGKEIYFHSEVRCFYDRSKNLETVFSVVQDVTEQKKAEMQLENSLKKERELSQLKSRFVSMASHEFRTPLTSIMSSVSLIEMLNEKGRLEGQKKYIKRIESSVDNLTTILNDFLSLEKLESGKVTVQNNPINLEEFLDELKDDVAPMLKDNQQIKHEHNGKQIIEMDPHLMKNVLLNLLSNAIKYSPENSTVLIQSFLNATQLEIKVIDQGIGIPEEEQKHMFTRFFRANNAFNIKGTGLGLTIVKRYLDLMKGKIEFTSVENEGTTFTIRIPQNHSEMPSQDN